MGPPAKGEGRKEGMKPNSKPGPYMRALTSGGSSRKFGTTEIGVVSQTRNRSGDDMH